MSCATGNCGAVCCEYPLAFNRQAAALGQIPGLPSWPGGGGADPVFPSDILACTQQNGQPGWQTEPGGLCFPNPGAPGYPTGPGDVVPPVQPPAGFPKLPGTPAPGTPVPSVPGVVTEQQCQSREQAAADAARRVEEAKVIKYTVMSAVVSGLVGVALGKLF